MISQRLAGKPKAAQHKAAIAAGQRKRIAASKLLTAARTCVEADIRVGKRLLFLMLGVSLPSVPNLKFEANAKNALCSFFLESSLGLLVLPGCVCCDRQHCLQRLRRRALLLRRRRICRPPSPHYPPSLTLATSSPAPGRTTAAGRASAGRKAQATARPPTRQSWRSLWDSCGSSGPCSGSSPPGLRPSEPSTAASPAWKTSSAHVRAWLSPTLSRSCSPLQGEGGPL